MRRSFLVPSLLTALALMPWRALDAAPLEEAEALMQSRNYAAAIAKLTDAALPAASDPAYALYVRALARHRARQHDAALADCDAVPAESAWHRKAVFLKALCLIELHRHQEAEAIYSAEAARLFSVTRKEKLAGVLAAYATELTREPLPGEPPLHANRIRALALYGSALEIETGPVLREELQHHRAEILRDIGRAKELDAACIAYLQEFDPDWTGAVGSVERSRGQKNAKAIAGRHRWEMRVMLAENALNQNQRLAARQYAQELLALWKAKPLPAGSVPDAGDVEWLVCRTHGAVTVLRPVEQQRGRQGDDGVPGIGGRNGSRGEPGSRGARGLGGGAQGDISAPQMVEEVLSSDCNPAQHIEALRAFLKNHPKHARTAEAARTLAGVIAAQGKNEEAIAAYDQFLKEPARTAPAPDLLLRDKRPAAERLADWQQEAFFAIGSLRFALKQYPQAIAQWRDYTTKHPNGPLWQQAQSRIIDAEFQLCLEPVAANDEDSARKRFDEFTAKYPLDPRAPQLLFLAGQFAFAKAQQLEKSNAPAAQVRVQHEKAVGEWAKLVSKYPESEEASLATYRTAVLQTGPLERYEDGLATFKRLTWGGWTKLAQERAALLPQKSLALSTERVFRSTEKPSVHVSVRNIEKLRVSVFKLSMEDYFRSRHRLDGDEGIGSLDIDLIQPDKTFEVPVAGYARLKSIEQDIEVPFVGAELGVKIVRVEGEDWQASTVVIRSDVDFIVESAWKEAIVFAQNRLTNQPVADAEVLISNGKQLIGQGRTGADGVFSLRGPVIREAANLCVHLRTPQGEAMQRLNLVGMTQEITGGDDPTAGSITRRGYLYTDRGTYRAGETVHFRGIIRDVKDGAYLVPEGRGFLVRVLSEEKRVLSESRVKLNAFGTFEDSVPLPPGTPAGDYTITATADDGIEKYHGTFRVEVFELSALQMSFEFKPEIVFPGDVIHGTVRVRHYWGSAAKDEAVRVRMPDGRLLEGRTDADGAFAFTQGTAGFQPGEALGFEAYLPSQDFLNVSATVPLRTSGVALAWEHVPKTILSGEAATVRVKCTSPASKPIAQAAKLTVFRTEAMQGNPVLAGLPGLNYIATAPAPVKVAEVELKTDAKTGIADAFFTPQGDGMHVLVIEARDARGNPVTLKAIVSCSGANDAVKLRILGERDKVDEGATLTVRAHSRIAAPLALVTFAGENILEHRVVPLKAGHNPLDVVVREGAWPQFDVTVAFLDGRQLHRARETFTVRRHLKLTLTPPAETVEPGAETEIKLTATDQQGRPVQAELSLALASQALFAEYPEEVDDIGEFFSKGARTGTSYRFQSSAGFELLAQSRQLHAAKDGGAAKSVAAVNHVERIRQLERQEADEYQRGGLQTLTLGGGNTFTGNTTVGGGTLTLSGNNSFQGTVTTGNRSGQTVISANAIDALLAGTGSGGLLSPGISSMVGAPTDLQFQVTVTRKPQIPQMTGSFPMTPTTPLPVSHGVIASAAQWHYPIVTDAKGNASLKITAPAEHGAWRLAVIGCTVTTLVGAAEKEIITRKKFFLETRAPAALREGDSWQPEVVAHLLEGAEGEATVSATNEFPAGPKHFEKTVKLASGRAVSVLFDPVVIPHGVVSLKWTASARIAQSGADVSATLAIIPAGFAQVVNAGGTLSAASKFTLALPAGAKALSERRLASVHFRAADLLFDMAMQRQPVVAGFETAPQTAASSLLSVVSALRIGRVGKMPQAAQTALDDRIRELIAELQLTQTDGGWPWQDVKGTDWKRDSVVTSLGLWGLREASALGFAVSDDAIKAGVKYLKSALAIIPPNEAEKSALILHALALEKDADFSVANRLYRDRATLNEPALAFLAGAFLRMEREGEAREILDTLAKKASRAANAGEPIHWKGSTAVARLSQADDITAIALWSLAKGSPKSPLCAAAASHLLREGGVQLGAQSPLQGLWAAALAEFFTTQPEANDAADFEGELTVNGKPWRKISAADLAASPSIFVPENLLAEGANEIATKITAGKVHPLFHASLFATNEKQPAAAAALPQIVKRTYLHDTLRHHDTMLEAESTSPVKTAEHGQIVPVEIEIKNPDSAYASYMMIEEPVPAGFFIVEGSLKSNHARMERTSSGLRLWFTPGEIEKVSYSLLAHHPGVWRVPPTILRDACRPERVRFGKDTVLTVLAPGARSPDAYVMNREERFELATKLFEENALAEARVHLDALHADAEARKRFERDVARMLLWIHTEQAQMDAKRVVELFETLSERHADLVIPYEKILRVAAAYRQIGEFERSWFVDRATIESSFVRDARVSAALRAQGDFIGAADHLLGLWAEYPDVHDVLLAHFSLAQDFQDRAPNAAAITTRAGTPKPTRTQFLERSRDLLRRHLTLYANDTEADGAAFNLSNVYFDLKDYAKVAAQAEMAAATYPKSTFLTSFQYMAALGHFWQYEFPKALAAAAPVAAGNSKDAGNARYITGQIHQAQGHPEEAIAWYRKVRDEFSDAADSISYLEEKRVMLPLASTFKPGQPVRIDLSSRNVKSAALKVYKVDLLKLHDRRSDIADVTKVNLAGITPEVELTVPLGDGKDFAWKRKSLDLPVKAEGAYLVICRGDDLSTSGLVIITTLELELREDGENGALRVHVKDGAKGGYVADADIKVFDSFAGEPSSGRTDPRGVFQASDITGHATVVVRHGDTRYAFFRTIAPLRPAAKIAPARTSPNAPAPATSPAAKPKGMSKEDYLFNVKEQLRGNQIGNKSSWEEKVSKGGKGVEAQKALKK